MRVIAVDTETGLIRPARLAPDLVCVTWQERGQPAQIEHVSTVKARLRSWLEDPNVRLVFHNGPFDLAVIGEEFPELLPLIFRAFDEDRITDTLLRQKLIDLAGGRLGGRFVGNAVYIKHGYSLEDLSKRVAGQPISKEGFRLFYSFFRNVPLAGWTDAARALQARGRAFLAGSPDLEFEEMRNIIGDPVRFAAELDGMIAADPSRVSSYPLDDATATLAIYEKQEAHVSYLDDQYRQARAAFWLHLSSAWGLRTDEVGVELLRSETQAAYDKLLADLVEAGLVRANGSRDTKIAKARMIEVCRRDDIEIRRTEAHATEGESKCKDADGAPLEAGDEACAEHICLDADACNASGDDLLVSYAELSTQKKVLSNDVEALLKGIAYPVHTSYGFAATGRTTSARPNIQNVGKREGIRECFVPRPGKIFIAADFPALESYAWAQCCVSWLGQSKMAEALNSGMDPHIIAAAVILRISYEQALSRYEAGDQEVSDVRQLAKVENFGWPGGMGPPTMLASAKRQLKPEVVARLRLDEQRMAELKEDWLNTWPEARPHFARVKSLGPPYPMKYRASVESLFTKRVRGDASYCAACNNGFQALGSDCAKRAGWLITRSLYTLRDSPLFNSRMVGFVHDEFIVETDDGPGAHDAAFELARLMCEGANEYLRDVPIALSKIKPVLMKRWSKKAKQVFNEEGRLVAWQ